MLEMHPSDTSATNLVLPGAENAATATDIQNSRLETIPATHSPIEMVLWRVSRTFSPCFTAIFVISSLRYSKFSCNKKVRDNLPQLQAMRVPNGKELMDTPVAQHQCVGITCVSLFQKITPVNEKSESNLMNFQQSLQAKLGQLLTIRSLVLFSNQLSAC